MTGKETVRSARAPVTTGGQRHSCIQALHGRVTDAVPSRALQYRSSSFVHLACQRCLLTRAGYDVPRCLLTQISCPDEHARINTQCLEPARSLFFRGHAWLEANAEAGTEQACADTRHELFCSERFEIKTREPVSIAPQPLWMPRAVCEQVQEKQCVVARCVERPRLR